jgi:23S rRNA (uracil1939-C5)-methyltransferase
MCKRKAVSYAKHLCQLREKMRPLLALPYREQLAQKQARLQELLGGFAPVKAVQGMAEPLHYRNKAIASFATQRGKLVCGLYAEGTHRVLPGADCLLQEEILNKTLAAVLDAARACRWTAYDEDRGTGLLRHTVLRSSGDGKVLVTLVTPGPDLPGSKNFCTALRKKASWVVSIVQNINPTRSSAVLGSREKTLYGLGFVLDTLCGTQFAISSRSFYQVNRTQTEVLYKKALELAKLTGRETVIDAYCGIGTIGLCAAPLAKQVIGVERNPAAVKDAAANARRNKIANARFVCADATEWMAAAAGEGLHPDVVFLDPPRAGSTPECIAAVNKMKPRRVVYVSCDPETLARDVAAFTCLGWRAAKFCPVDLFPQTKHVETVVLLSHKKADSYIHIDVEFGEGEGKIPVDSIAKRAEAYKPKEKVTYKMIKEYIEAKYGFKVHTAYIAEVKRNLGLPMYDAPNAVEELKQPRKHPTPEKVEAIKDALRYFAVI